MADAKHEITINADFKSVLEAITTEKGLKSWWTSDVEAKPVIGSEAKFGFFNREVVFTMRIDKIAPENVEWTCVSGPDEWVGTRQKFILVAGEEKGTTSVRFTHAGWKTDSGAFPHCNTTWGHLMILLKQYVEGKNTAPYFN